MLEFKAIMLNNDMDISSLVVYMQQAKDEKKKYTEMRERHWKMFRYLEHGASQFSSGMMVGSRLRR